jgi:hypothetical protein
MCHRYRRAVALAALALLPSSAPCSLVGPSVHGLAVGQSEVVVRVGSRILLFDYEGSFLRELAITGFPLSRAKPLALTDDGRLWFEVAEEDEEGKRKAITLAAADGSGAVAIRHQVAGAWTAYVTARGQPYVGRVEAKRLRVDRLDAVSGRRSVHADIGIEKALRILDLDVASAVSWAGTSRAICSC